MRDLSIIIPASNKNGVFVNKTIESILANKRADTEIIVVYNGAWPEPGIPSHELVTLVHYNEKVGQRIATNAGVRISKSKYIMKLDAHCAVDEGFDAKMIAEMHDDWTMVPLMKNLHAFDWICPDGHRRYQGPSGPCAECGKETTRDILWMPKESPKSVSFCFDATPHFQYFGEFQKRPEGKGDVTETMSIQGSCFMLTRDKYIELNICDEAFGSWGSQGIEVACKTWLSGGSVMCNKKTWYAHMFRTQGGDFSFSHHIPQKDVDFAKSYARDLFFNGKWPQQKKPLSWLVEKFWPVKGWTEEDLAKLKTNSFSFPETVTQKDTDEIEAPNDLSVPTVLYDSSRKLSKGIIYYTDNELDEEINTKVKKQLKKISEDKKIPIVSSSLQPINFGDKNISHPHLKRSRLTLFKQILAALEASTAETVFFCEHDVLYHPSHFDFVPPRQDVYYYNTNVWKVRWSDHHALWVDDCKQLSGLCGNREFLIRHYKRRLEIILQRQKEILALGEELVDDGISKYMGYEPGLHSYPRGVDDYPVEAWQSPFPIIDIRHDNNFTKSRWTKEEFKEQKYTEGWTESSAEKIPGWERYFTPTKGIIYYTHNQLDEVIAKPVRDQLTTISQNKNIPIVSASLKRISFGVKNVCFPSLKRGYLAMFKQILGALENSTADIIFFCEHDVLYHPSHFDFIPSTKDKFYYNENVWKIDLKSGFALHQPCKQVSGISVYRDLAIKHYRKRFDLVSKNGFSMEMGFEPGTHHRESRVDDLVSEGWKSLFPNIDIRHDHNLSPTRWTKEEFRNKKFTEGWIEGDIDTIPGWKNLKEVIK